MTSERTTILRKRPRRKRDEKIRDRIAKPGMLLDTTRPGEAVGPFATFTEWSNEADENAYASL
jgi:hypothetical protein